MNYRSIWTLLIVIQLTLNEHNSTMVISNQNQMQRPHSDAEVLLQKFKPKANRLSTDKNKSNSHSRFNVTQVVDTGDVELQVRRRRRGSWSIHEDRDGGSSVSADENHIVVVRVNNRWRRRRKRRRVVD